jgi:two-component system phosphate regulon response regulator PhoB
MAKILVVEDERTNRLLATTLLRHAGHDVFEAAEASTGLRLALEERPDLLLVDLSLPDYSGAEFIRRVRLARGGATVPIVLYTASAIDAATRDFMEMHAIQHAIEKPSAPDGFLRTIESALHDR